VHNDYLNTLAEYGTTGGIIVIFAVGALGWGVLRTWKYVRRSNEIATRTSNRSAVVLGCGDWIAGNSFPLRHRLQHAYSGQRDYRGDVCSRLRPRTCGLPPNGFWFKPGIFGRALVSLVLIAAAGYFGWQISRLGQQTYWLAKYYQPLTYEQHLEMLQKAFAAEPKSNEVAIEIGMQMRRKAFDGDEGWEELTRAAIPWFEKAISLNRWNPFNYTAWVDVTTG
jgi:hypothetical protein